MSVRGDGGAPGWDPQRLPRHDGAVAVVTGANAGLGFFTTYALASTGMRVVLACRNRERADAALRAVRTRLPGADLDVLLLDTADLASVRRAGERVAAYERLDVLVANAGMVHPPRRRMVSPDGNELVLATNHLGHFAFIQAAMPALARTTGSRVVNLGSMVSRLMPSQLTDLQLEQHYSAARAYAQSKIAVQSFGFELDRRLRDAGLGVSSLVAHPGYAISGNTPRVPGVNEPTGPRRFVDSLQQLIGAQGKNRGAEALVRAALDPAVTGGQYVGPRYVVRGAPVVQAPTRASLDPAVAGRLWSLSEQYTGTSFVL